MFLLGEILVSLWGLAFDNFKLKPLTLENISGCDFSLFSSSWKRKGSEIRIQLLHWETTESPSSLQRKRKEVPKVNKFKKSLPILKYRRTLFIRVMATTLGGITNTKLHASALQAISDTSVNVLVNRKHLFLQSLVKPAITSGQNQFK